MVNVTVIASLIAAIAAIIAPVITAIIKIRHEEKTAYNNYLLDVKQRAIEGYIFFALNFLYNPSDEQEREYKKALCLILLYIGQDLRNKVKEIDDLLCDIDIDKEYCQERIIELAQLIAITFPNPLYSAKTHSNIKQNQI